MKFKYMIVKYDNKDSKDSQIYDISKYISSHPKGITIYIHTRTRTHTYKINLPYITLSTTFST